MTNPAINRVARDGEFVTKLEQPEGHIRTLAQEDHLLTSSILCLAYLGIYLYHNISYK